MDAFFIFIKTKKINIPFLSETACIRHKPGTSTSVGMTRAALPRQIPIPILSLFFSYNYNY